MHVPDRAWTDDCTAICPRASAEVVHHVGRDLLGRWSEGARAYHSTTHLTEVLAALSQLTNAGMVRGSDLRLARMAAWFHDAVNDPRAATGANEAASAELARDALTRLNADPDDVARIVALIEMTVNHNPAGADPAADALHDADLWILAAPDSRYDEYSAAVRAEYAHVPIEVYARQRGAILATFLARQPLYRTAHAQANWDSHARANLAGSVDALSALARGRD